VKPETDDAVDAPQLDEAGLLRQARDLRHRAYAPYSGFHVGAVLVSASGRTYPGVNVENAAYGLTRCAEQSAVQAMVTAGDTGPVVALAVVGDGEEPCTPCGACRQVLLEFGPDATVLMSGDGGRPLRATAAELLPHGFTPVRLATGVRRDR
jgi:cytidine deaminase